MKTIQTTILFLILLLFGTGCMKENTDDCPDGSGYSLVLLFEYLDPEGNDVFTERINNIDVVIYDEDHTLYRWMNADDVITNPERSKTIDIEPGTYYIVSWANNVTNRTRPEQSNNVDMEHTYIYHNLSTISSDRLHYAPDLRKINPSTIPGDLTPYTVKIANTGTTRHTVSYMGAHRTVNVYLRGFDEIASGDLEDIQVSISNLTESYNSFMNRGIETVTYHKNATEVTMNEEELGFAPFYVPHFDNESPVTIDIAGTNPSGTPYSFSVTMDEVLEELELVLTEGDCEIIDVIIELKDTYVLIKVPEWKIIEVDPGYN